jgi:hypothetical protein
LWHNRRRIWASLEVGCFVPNSRRISNRTGRKTALMIFSILLDNEEEGFHIAVASAGKQSTKIGICSE